MKVLLDTNVLIAAFITHGVCSDLLEHCLRQHELITSEAILEEFRQHLVRQFNYSTAEVEEAVIVGRKMSNFPYKKRGV